MTQLAISQYGVLLLDINMPGRSGLDVLQDVKHMYPQLPVIMVSVQPENQYARAVCGPEPSAYVNKNSASEELRPRLRNILGAGHELRGTRTKTIPNCEFVEEAIKELRSELSAREPHAISHTTLRFDRFHVVRKTLQSSRDNAYSNNSFR